MNVQQVKEAIKEIEEISYDDERAHSMEDSLLYLVIESIAKGECENPKEVCKETLKVNDLDFCRWCS